MAKTNAQRQAEYRKRQKAHVITPDQLKFVIWAAYHLGRDDQRSGKKEWYEQEGKGNPLETIEARTLDQFMNDELDRERRWGTWE